MTGGFGSKCPAWKCAGDLEFERDTQHFMAPGSGPSWSLKYVKTKMNWFCFLDGTWKNNAPKLNGTIYCLKLSIKQVLYNMYGIS
jgi:hypothetical protein